MNRPSRMADWEAFVVAHGWRAQAYELAAVVGQPLESIHRLRATGVCTCLDKPKCFAELFAQWHGREPRDSEWPAPRKVGARGTYEWQPPELALLASLVGQLSQAEIAEILSTRLRERTGDQDAARGRNAVQARTNRIGLQTADVVGGLTTAEAAREIGSSAIVNQAIEKGHIPTRRIGRRHVIPYAAWEDWKAKRVFPPADYVQLSTIREALAIKSDKLSEFARAGLIPTAIRCNPYGSKGASTQFGTWWVSRGTADRLLADRRAGRPMPWHGQCADNLRRSFELWLKRRHPASCPDCAEIWGKAGVPTTFDEYAARYPALAHGAKRHLTYAWSPGLTLQELARRVRKPLSLIRRAVANGALTGRLEGRRRYVAQTEAARWQSAGCPTGEGARSWIALGTAEARYLFTVRELRAFIQAGDLKTRVGTEGAARGTIYVSRRQCCRLREKIGFTEEQVARRLKITIARLRHLLEGVQWRKADKIPLETVQAVRKRMASRCGYTIEEAALALGSTVTWVGQQIAAGAVRVSRAPWDRRRVYISEAMLGRLRAAQDRKAGRPGRTPAGSDWLTASIAATEAGVCIATLNNWGKTGALAYRQDAGIRIYHRSAVRARARRYWQTTRRHRAVPPAWLLEERHASQD